jgi:DNA-binding response OmpR family regulator
MFFVPAPRSNRRRLRYLRAKIPLVVTERNLATGSRRDLLDNAFLLPDPPILIVTSRLPDEYLWAEALNLGAYNVLAKPFDASEVMRILDSAWRHWTGLHGDSQVRNPHRMAARQRHSSPWKKLLLLKTISDSSKSDSGLR